MADIMRRFLKALVQHDPSDLPLAPDVRATENEIPMEIGTIGLWTKATAVDDNYQFVFEDRTYEAAFHTLHAGFVGLVWRGKEASLCSIRLKVMAGRISEIDLIQGGKFRGSTASDPRDSCKTFRENFARKLKEPKFTRDQLIRIALLYYESIGSDHPCYVPFGEEFRRIENGTSALLNPNFHQEEWYVNDSGGLVPNFAAMSAREQHATQIWSADLVTDKRVHVVDVERGLVWVHSIYRPWYRRDSVQIEGVGILRPDPKIMHHGVATMTELIKIGDTGNLEDMESVWIIMPKGTGTIWA
ncbi:uncharacterized protein PV06_11805 [Exophiala oligosperma]|uniref:DUF8021 domain-containing protein n=1 Tax=Exophiala oligosperma TaxID=215243 RepID=A0A0D2D0V2_9EURO|nr:uncharacterized protein PV06_11805 [Exophiala oligosperma]KIW35870.1 hypothetical protein PV06_11805 [Exophiala oligosperma]